MSRRASAAASAQARAGGWSRNRAAARRVIRVLRPSKFRHDDVVERSDQGNKLIRFSRIQWRPPAVAVVKFVEPVRIDLVPRGVLLDDAVLVWCFPDGNPRFLVNHPEVNVTRRRDLTTNQTRPVTKLSQCHGTLQLL